LQGLADEDEREKLIDDLGSLFEDDEERDIAPEEF